MYVLLTPEFVYLITNEPPNVPVKYKHRRKKSRNTTMLAQCTTLLLDKCNNSTLSLYSGRTISYRYPVKPIGKVVDPTWDFRL